MPAVFLLSFIVYIFYYYFFKFFFVSKNIDFVYIQALRLLSKKPEFLGRFSIICIEQFTVFSRLNGGPRINAGFK